MSRCKSKTFVDKTTAGYKKKKKAQEAINYLEEIITQQRKSHALGEDVTMPAYKIIMGKMLGPDWVQKVE